MVLKTHTAMIKEFSKPIIKYILNEIPPYIGLVVLQADEEGLIKRWYGPLEKYISVQPVVGQSIEDIAPFLVGIIPPLVNPMVISHLRINEDAYVDLHLLNDDDNQTWIFLVDQTRQVEIILPILQQYNTDKLNSSADRSQSSAKGTLAALYLLDYMSFEKEKNGYKPLGSAPAWFGEIQKNLHFNIKIVDLSETFPYIEVFQIEAEEIWKANQDGKLVSGVWEENKITGEKIYLQALALRHEKRNYLLIKPLNQQSDLNDGFIQKAREQKLTLDQLANAEKKLKELLSFKDQFVSIISHDLRSPIGAVIGLADLLVTDDQLLDKLTDDQLELLTDIKSEMLRLLDYNDKLYQWSNLELGNFKISKKEIVPLHLANYVERMQLTKLKQKNIRFEKEIDPKFTLNADETLLGHAINNLVGNAVKFTPENGTIRLRFTVEAIGKSIKVSDTGQGMDKETCDKLFAGFIRKTTTGTSGEKGTGLGLGIVKKILDAHDYTIQVESAPGMGTTFSILLN